jgi:hypothetical protein
MALVMQIVEGYWDAGNWMKNIYQLFDTPTIKLIVIFYYNTSLAIFVKFFKGRT